MEGRWTLVRADDGTPEAVLALNADIRQRKANEREIQRLAFYYPLTACLPNRMLLMDRINLALAKAQRQGQGGALLFIDLDNFKTLNDTLGHDKGDLLLQQVAKRLNTCVRSVDTVARLGGDEFVVMIEELSNDPDALAHAPGRGREGAGGAVRSLRAGRLPVPQHAQHRHRAFPRDAPTSVGELLKQADLAMYQAKTAGRNTLRFFDPGMQAVVSARATLEADLRAALSKDEFTLHYQPQVDHHGHIVGVEALLRWSQPRRGMVTPGEFIPLAEETGLIMPLGRWVLHTACKLLAGWRDEPDLAHLTMAVNVSSRQFRHASFVDDVARVLAITGAPSGQLKLELTETLLVEDMETTIATMSALRAYGVRFSLDDFGTGYSSLSYLKRMPLDQLKIDRSFVNDLLQDPNDAAIVDTIIGLSRSLGLQVIAEGVKPPASANGWPSRMPLLPGLPLQPPPDGRGAGQAAASTPGTLRSVSAFPMRRHKAGAAAPATISQSPHRLRRREGDGPHACPAIQALPGLQTLPAGPCLQAELCGHHHALAEHCSPSSRNAPSPVFRLSCFLLCLFYKEIVVVVRAGAFCG